MQYKYLIDKKVHNYYWNDDLNCATTTIKILSEIFQVNLSTHIIDAVIGMHGAGKYGAQCGLVEGTLLFIGIYGKQRSLSNDEIVNMCYDFAEKFEEEFGSLVCRTLRPQGFKPDNPPHLCEEITKKAIEFSRNYLSLVIK
ncbi:C-GCAxxG-C-C family protein [Desulfosporosinus sp. FKA]|uniref:C-GCAxxG-C-C family protein n=1 Tax=Desulfosporosinus sp. FKA TaxID=1969834 RepID=UPI000B49CAC7|nr:C-GCAxxG-C-C family protein [Desulfosporosinus sp. FKA]